MAIAEPNRDRKTIGPPLRNRVADMISRHSMLTGGETVLVGLSGGPDSVCLLHLLNELREELSLSLSAVYVDHKLRPGETPGEILFCRKMCEDLGITFLTKTADVRSLAGEKGLNIHEAGRELRYKAFDEAALEVGAVKIALAHNADDQAETFFLRLLRGTGPAGLSGIPAKRGRVIRPLLETDRRVIEEYLGGRGIKYMVDSSNLKPDYFRNRVRLRLMPVLDELSPSARETLRRTMEIIREEERYFGVIVTKALMKLISRKTPERIELFLSPMEGLDIVILRRVLRHAMEETRGLRGTGFGHIEDIVRLVKRGRSGDRLYLPKGIRVIRDYSLLVITSELPRRISAYELLPPDKVAIREAGVVISAAIEGSRGEADGRTAVVLDAGAMRFPLIVRPRENGDFFFPIGFGRKKKLQDFFVDQKVPRDERDAVPVVASGDDIVWIAGYRADDRFRVTEKTEKFVRLAILKGNF